MCRIEFLTLPDQMGRFPHPYPASKAVPDWIKAMPMDRGGGPTLKRCPPFLEAMTAGYIIPAPADVQFEVSPDAKMSWQSRDKVIGGHFGSQFQGAPFGNELVLKFINPWVIRTPPGYSTLITAPFNRFHMPFVALSGIVETESYYREVHLPMICTMRPGTRFLLARGTPLVQVIPFRREKWTSEALPLDEAQRNEAERPFQAEGHLGVYKSQFWRKHEYGQPNDE